MELDLGDLGQHHLQPKIVFCATSRPPVCAIPSMTSELGITGRGEMVVQMILGQADVLDRRGLLPADELGVSIDPEPTHR